MWTTFSTEAFVILTFLSLSRLRQVGGKGQFLHCATQGKADEQNGLWGGFINDENNGRAQDLRQVGFYCMDMHGSFYSGLKILSMSYDKVSGRALLWLDEKTRTTTSAIEVPVCGASPTCTNPEAEVLFYRAENTDEVQRAKIGPMALHNSSIYFVAQRFSTGPNGDKSRLHRMEIRKLKKCQRKLPFTRSHKFDIDKCSEYVGLVAEEVGNNIILEMRETLYPTDHLEVVSAGDELVFLLQANNRTYDRDEDLRDYSIQLMALTAYAPGSTRMIHRQPVPLRYTWNHYIQIGGISFKDNVLCWTTMDRILCARWDLKSSARQIRTVLHPGIAARVCSAPNKELDEQRVLRNITTGIAISEVGSWGVSFYFGCHVGTEGFGGSGFVTLSSNWKSYELTAVIDERGELLAGTMFLTPPCDHMQSDQQHDNHADSHATEVVVVAEKSTSIATINAYSASSYLTCILCLLRIYR